MIVDDLLKNPGSWLSMGESTGVVISSRIRLARNLKGTAFPSRACAEDCLSVRTRLREAFEKMSTTRNALYLEMESLGPVDREVLKERHLISHEFTEKLVGRGLLVGENEQVAVMINEEDHVRLQAICPGMDLPGVWEKVDAVDSELEEHVEYAFSPRLGYLTACPTNVGTGLRASVMLHLPGLRLMNDIDGVVKGLEKIGLAVRGVQGEGTEAAGDMFQVSNQTTLGESEKGITDRLIRVIGEVARHEQNARLRLLESRKAHLMDHIGRAYGILVNARVLASREAVDMLSALRLGVEFGAVENLTVGQINEIMLLMQPGHLQKIAGNVIGPDDRDEIRAEMVRQKLEHVTLRYDEKNRGARRRRQMKKQL